MGPAPASHLLRSQREGFAPSFQGRVSGQNNGRCAPPHGRGSILSEWPTWSPEPVTRAAEPLQTAPMLSESRQRVEGWRSEPERREQRDVAEQRTGEERQNRGERSTHGVAACASTTFECGPMSTNSGPFPTMSRRFRRSQHARCGILRRAWRGRGMRDKKRVGLPVHVSQGFQHIFGHAALGHVLSTCRRLAPPSLIDNVPCALGGVDRSSRRLSVLGC